MFWQIGGFILLTVFATGSVAVIRTMRHITRGAAMKAELETEKVRQQLTSIKHEGAIREHQQHLQVLALTTGEENEKAQKVEEAVEEIRSRPEEVKPDEVTNPPWNYNEGVINRKLRRESEVAEFDPIEGCERPHEGRPRRLDARRLRRTGGRTAHLLAE